MNPKLLSRTAIDGWVAALIRARTVCGPQAKGNRFGYDVLRSPADLRLDHVETGGLGIGHGATAPWTDRAGYRGRVRPRQRPLAASDKPRSG